MESEVIALNLAAREAAWINKLVNILDPIDICVNIGIDNQAAIYFANADSDHTRAKHIDTRYYYVKGKVDEVQGDA